MKVIRYVDVWEGAQSEDLCFTAPKFLSARTLGVRRFKVELELPDPIVDGVVQARAIEDCGDPKCACQAGREIPPGEPVVHLHDNAPK